MCNILLRDPANNLWALGADDTGDGSTTLQTFQFDTQKAPVIKGPTTYWVMTADIQGEPILTLTGPVPNAFSAIAVTSPGGLNFQYTVDDSGEVYLTPIANGPLPADQIPSQPDITMSRWPRSAGLYCSTCGNATVTGLADLSFWCCACNSFVLPEDTNEIVILDE